MNSVAFLLKNNIEEIQSKKKFISFLIRECIFIYGVLFILRSLININSIDINKYYSGIFIATCIASTIYLYSSIVYGKQNKLINVLPILRKDLFVFFRLEIFIRIFLTKFMPIILGIGICEILNNTITYIDMLKMICFGAIVFGFSVSLSFIIIFYLLNKNTIKMVITSVLSIIFLFLVKYIYTYYGIFFILYLAASFSSYKIFSEKYKYFIASKKKKIAKKTSLIRREFNKFFSDKVLVANYIVVLIATIVFVGNIIFYNVSEYPIISLMLILPLSSCTTAYLYSYEGDRINFIKMLPIKFSRIILSECVVSFFLTTFIYVIALGALYLKGLISIEYCGIYILNVMLICIYKVVIDINNPILDFKHTEQLLRNTRKYRMFIKLSIAYIPMILYSFFNNITLIVLILILDSILILFDRKKFK